LVPFRTSGAAQLLPEGYSLIQSPESDLATEGETATEALNRLLVGCDERPRSPERWSQVLERSTWHLGVKDRQERLVGFLRATSDLALNANLWDLVADPADLAMPRTADASDATRRSVVLDRYRQGQQTHATRSDDERVTVSQVAK
jgi:hypothetical protein